MKARRLVAAAAATMAVMVPTAAWGLVPPTVSITRNWAHLNHTATVAQMPVNFTCPRRFKYVGEYTVTLHIRQRRGDRVIRAQGWREDDAGPCDGRRQTAMVWAKIRGQGGRRFNPRRPAMARGYFDVFSYDDKVRNADARPTKWKRIDLTRGYR